MAKKGSPFGRAVRMEILKDYFTEAGPVTPDNAWEHVYRCLLWMNEAAGLAHIYDSNHMQPGGVFHSRALRFTDALCKHWNVDRAALARVIDVLFRGCVAELQRRQSIGNNGGPPMQDKAEPTAGGGDITGEDADIEAELESELIGQIAAELTAAGLSGAVAEPLAQRIEASARHFFTIGNKRKNALGEGFEDLLELLLVQAAEIPVDRIKTRTPVSKMPGFRKALPRKKGSKAPREPRPDIAIVQEDITHVIATAKWSIRQDRETQLASEYQAFQMNKVQSTELQYFLITNEFDLARLRNMCKAIPGGTGGYVLHTVYHVCLPLLRQTHGERFNLEGYVDTGRLASLSDFLEEMRARFGATQPL